MTDEQKLRELDAWIAENVMGLGYDSYAPMLGCSDCESDTVNCSIPNYTTNSSAAMQVLEKCGEKISGQVHGEKRSFKIEIYQPSVSKDWCVCQRDNCGVYGQGKTLPLAICLMAKQLFAKE